MIWTSGVRGTQLSHKPKCILNLPSLSFVTEGRRSDATGKVGYVVISWLIRTPGGIGLFVASVQAGMYHDKPVKQWTSCHDPLWNHLFPSPGLLMSMRSSHSGCPKILGPKGSNIITAIFLLQSLVLLNLWILAGQCEPVINKAWQWIGRVTPKTLWDIYIYIITLKIS